MSKILYIYYKVNTDRTGEMKKLLQLVKPATLSNELITVERFRNIHIGIMNSSHSMRVCEGSLHNLPVQRSEAVSEPYYGITRIKDETIEVSSDEVSSKALWYVLTEEFFAVSTSQRLLVGLLQSYHFNRQTISWMLASGIILHHSWDERITMLQPRQQLTFHIDRWKYSIQEKPFKHFDPSSNQSSITEQLAAAIEVQIGAMETGAGTGLPLSGGYDSRCLLILLKRFNKSVDALTWGNLSATSGRSDLDVAAQLASHYGVPHHRFNTAPDREHAPGSVLHEFLLQGEGRNDHIGAHFDRFDMWEQIRMLGIDTIIRGDEGFGWVPVHSADDVRRSVGLIDLSVYFDEHTLKRFGLDFFDEPLSRAFLRQPGESMATWRDRLYHQFRLPYIICPLNDIISGFVEVKTPFLSRHILHLVRRLDDRKRTAKKAFRDYVGNITPPIPFAVNYSGAALEDRFTNDFFDLFDRELRSDTARELFATELLEYLAKELDGFSARTRGEDRSRMLPWLAAHTPKALKSYVRKIVPPKLSPVLLAYRVTLICEMHRILTTDSKTLDHHNQ